MNKYELVSKIESFAPVDTQEAWDCSGWLVEGIRGKNDVNKVLLALTVTDAVVEQARAKKCDLIISHHPLFFVPLEYKDIDIYASHTPMDKAKGGTTDTIIKQLGFDNPIIENEFVRIVELDISVDELRDKLKTISPNLRVVNNLGVDRVKRIAFCAGSGSEFIDSTDCDAFVTGDLKYHTAVEADKVLFDIGHFESEILVLEVFKDILGIDVEFADEKSPFI